MSTVQKPYFLTFHVDTSARTDGSGPHPSANLAHSQYLNMIDLLFRSVDLFHPGARGGILSNPETDLSGLRLPYERFDNKLDPSRLMLERTLAQHRFIETYDFKHPLVLIDSDILLNRPINDVLKHDFDVAVTWRKSSSMPINGGLLILNNRRPEAVRAFFARFVNIYLERYADESAKWYGDQLALCDCVGLNHRQMSGQLVREIDGCRILFLSCDIFNFSPANKVTAILNRDPSIAIMHFKGERKRLMEPYWLTHLLPRKSWAPRSLWQAWCSARQLRALAATEPQEEMDSQDD